MEKWCASKPAKRFRARPSKHSDLPSDFCSGTVGLCSGCVHRAHYVFGNAPTKTQLTSTQLRLDRKTKGKKRRKKDAEGEEKKSLRQAGAGSSWVVFPMAVSLSG